VKKLLVTVGLLISGSIFAQHDKTVGIYFGTNSSVGTECLIDIYDSNFVIGGGMSVGYHVPKTIGFDATVFDYQDTYDNQKLVNTVASNTLAIYCPIGFRYKRVRFLSRIGLSVYNDFENYHDPSKILGEHGYYYVQSNTYCKALIGGQFNFPLFEDWRGNIGYDTFNYVIFGLSYDLSS
jgi:hypothetical protein